ncbi:hypothetical protein HMPREF9065_01569 [Aggregatibacter sp. oral taxon 458 str. W10330]|nr:hypothetical protein HMPREF9065_01569 [Aggregatibacter sp. oral taxon 458 str. W10330]
MIDLLRLIKKAHSVIAKKAFLIKKKCLYFLPCCLGLAKTLIVFGGIYEIDQNVVINRK